MEERSFRATLPNSLNFDECSSKVVPINDENYRVAIDWFKACLRLSENLPVVKRDEYELSVIGNLKNSLTNFFQRTELSLSTLIGLEKEVASMFHGLGQFMAAKSKSQSTGPDSLQEPYCDEPPPDSNTNDTDTDDMGLAINQLYKRYLWVALASIILLILLMIVLATMCWLRKYIEKDMKEIFIACPSREELNAGQESSMKQPSSGRRTTYQSRNTKISSGPRGSSDRQDDYYDQEDQEFLEVYGGREYAYPILSHPIRTWMTPLTRKRQPQKHVTCQARKTAIPEEKNSMSKQ